MVPKKWSSGKMVPGKMVPGKNGPMVPKWRPIFRGSFFRGPFSRGFFPRGSFFRVTKYNLTEKIFFHAILVINPDKLPNKLIKDLDVPTEQVILQQFMFFFNYSKNDMAVQPLVPVQPLVRSSYILTNFVEKKNCCWAKLKETLVRIIRRVSQASWVFPQPRSRRSWMNVEPATRISLSLSLFLSPFAALIPISFHHVPLSVASPALCCCFASILSRKSLSRFFESSTRLLTIVRMHRRTHSQVASELLFCCWRLWPAAVHQLFRRFVKRTPWTPTPFLPPSFALVPSRLSDVAGYIYIYIYICICIYYYTKGVWMV